MESKYSVKIEELDENTSHRIILSQITPGSTVLECGCASGYMTRYMKERLEANVSIIEQNPSDYDKAREYAVDGICADLEDEEWSDFFQGRTFDFILFADVLEHLRNPEEVLRRAVDLLREDGTIIASIPNVAHADIIINQLNGRWNYTPLGLLDNTHIHFWAEKNLDDLFRQAGLTVVEKDYTILPPFTTEQKSIDKTEDLLSAIHTLCHQPYADVYQFVYRAKKTACVRERGLSCTNHYAERHLKYWVEPLCCSEYQENQNRLTAQNTELEAQNCELTKQLEQQKIQESTIRDQQASIEQLTEQSQTQEQTIQDQQAYIEQLTEQSQKQEQTIQDRQAYIEQLEAQNRILSENYDTISNSNSWKITKPVRFALDNIKPFLRQSKRLQHPVHFYIDEFNSGGNMAHIRGWIFDRWNKIEKLELMLCWNGAEEIREITNRRLRRDDVAAAFHTKMGLQSGFDQFFQMKLPQTDTIKAYLLYTVKGQRKRIQIQGIKFTSFTGYVDTTKTDKPFLRENPSQAEMRPGEKYSYLLSKGMTSLKQYGAVHTLKRVRWYLKSGYIPQQAIQTNESDGPLDLEIYDAYQPPTDLNQRLKGKPVDIIVPIYNGTNLLPPLLESIPKTKMPYRLFLIDDKSPDQEILPMLHAYAESMENVTVIENQENLGYTRSINKGLKLTDGHVVLLNTDIRLPMYWLERLMTPILMHGRVASVTPFTNSGTICSFPRFLENNDIYMGLSVDEIDAAFGRMKPQYTRIPTGVGFCMALNRDALTVVGNYDEESFPRGYGEENDWCQRAEKAGFRNVMAENLFVYHQHGATFTSEEKQRLIQKHSRRLNQKHPNYDSDVQSYIRADPVKNYREMAQLLLFRKDAEAAVLAFSHAWGGGSAYYLDEKIKAFTKAGRDFLTIQYYEGRGYQLSRYFDGYSISASRNKLEQLLQFLPERLGELWVNELVSYPNLPQVLDQLKALSHESGAKLVFRLHDFYCVCPHITLLDDNDKFCGICSPQKCVEHCKKRRNIATWRKTWGPFLAACDEITAFSNNSAQLLRIAYPEIQNVTVVPHSVAQLRTVSPHRKASVLTIGVIGAINVEKGLKILEQMAEIIHRENLPVRITIIGYTAYEPKYGDIISCTGRYERDQLPEIIEKNRIDIVLIPSIWPETFSYTAEESIMMGLPIAVFDIGAPAERVRNYPKGIILREINAKAALEDIYEYWTRLEECGGSREHAREGN